MQFLDEFPYDIRCVDSDCTGNSLIVGNVYKAVGQTDDDSFDHDFDLLTIEVDELGRRDGGYYKRRFERVETEKFMIVVGQHEIHARRADAEAGAEGLAIHHKKPVYVVKVVSVADAVVPPVQATLTRLDK